MANSASGNPTAAGVIPALPRQRLADQIADVLRERMLVGALAAGAPIHERETSEALGVSRTPLREALLILEAEGLVDMSPARSPVVADPSFEELEQLLTVQAALEALAGELACANATATDLAHIRSLHEIMIRMNDGPDTVAHFKTDMTFHEAIVQATGNQPLIKTHKQYNSRLWRARYMSSSQRVGRAISMDDHHAVVLGLEMRDGPGTALVLRRHLHNAIKNIRHIFGADERPSTSDNAEG